MRSLLVFSLAWPLTTLPLASQEPGSTQGDSRTQFLGQPPPGLEATEFAPGLLPDLWIDQPTVFEAEEIYYLSATTATLWSLELREGTWTEPHPVAFAEAEGSNSVSLSPDGSRLIYSRLENGFDFDRNEWVTRRRAEAGWVDPSPLDPLVSGLLFISVSQSGGGSLYFDSKAEGFGECDIFWSMFEEGSFQEPRNLGSSVNTLHREWTPYIGPDEDYLLFSSDQPPSVGLLDIFVSFRRTDGSWAEPINLGPEINSTGQDLYPRVTNNGEFLFWHRDGAVYWIDAGIIDAKRPER